MVRYHFIAAGSLGLALAVAWVVWRGAPDRPLAVAAADMPRRINSHAVTPPVAAPAIDSSVVPTVTTLQAVVMPRFVTTVQTVTLTATAPRQVHVGEHADLVLVLGANSEVAEVAFTVQFDGNVLQVRNGAEGDWAAATRSKASFDVQVSGAEDRIQIRTAVSSPSQIAAGSSSVALVQFQAISQGTASLMISDVTVKDRSGHAMPFSLTPSTLQVTTESIAPSSRRVE